MMPLDIENVAQPTAVEWEALNRVFAWMDKDGDRKISLNDIQVSLSKFHHKITKQDMQLMIWEVDEDLDQHVSWLEFLAMYKRAINDSTGLEPRRLFHLVQFFMYDQTFSGEIGVEQTLQILFVRFGRELLDQEIHAIFGEDEKRSDGQEARVTLAQFLQKARERNRIKKRTVTYPKHASSLSRSHQTVS